MKEPARVIKNVYSWEELMNIKGEDMEDQIEQATTETTAQIVDNASVIVNGANIVEPENLLDATKREYPKNLVALNRLTRDGKAIVAAQGHSKNSFKRDYDTGTASYTCKNCKATLTVSAFSTEGIDGTVLSTRCTAPAQTA